MLYWPVCHRRYIQISLRGCEWYPARLNSNPVSCVCQKLAGPNERYDVAPIFWDGDVVCLHQDAHAALCQDGVRRPRLQGDWGVFLDLREDGQWCEHIIPEISISVIWSCIQGEVGVSGITFQEYDPKGCVKVVHLFFSVFLLGGTCQDRHREITDLLRSQVQSPRHAMKQR